MRSFYVATLVLLGFTVNLSAACDDIIISEYIEGSSYNKAIELYNPSVNDIDLSGYTLELYSNGNTVANASVELSGSVTSEGTFVVANPKADTQILNVADVQNGSVLNFNGDDALVLKKNGEIVDSFGQVGVDPGSEWNNNGVGTKDETLVRSMDVGCGDVNALDAFDPSLEWTSFPKNSFSYLGSYGANDDGSTEDALEISYIHTIQGSGNTSEMVGEKVLIEGVVTGNYTQNGGFKGFFVQEEDSQIDDDNATSEGIFIYCPTCTTDIQVGDLVQVKGEVTEYAGLTEIKADSVEVSGFNIQLPTAVTLTLPVGSLMDFERTEGMLVSLSAGTMPLVVNDNYTLGRYGSFTVASERMVQFTQNNVASVEGYTQHQEEVARKSIVIDDGSSFQNPWSVIYPEGGLSYENTLRAGYTISEIVGVMDERYGSYVVQPTTISSFNFDSTSNPRENAPERVTKKANKKFCNPFKKMKQHHRNHLAVRIASFNVLNYFNTFSDCTYGVGGNSADCRGADNAEEFERQRVKIINAMLDIDADVFGLMEIENDGYDERSALADLVTGLNEAIGSDVYDYVHVDDKIQTLNALGTDAIKVALIYNKKRMRLVGKPYALVLDENDKNRPSLMQVFKRRHSSRPVLVSVNHFKSKGSKCDALSYDDVFDVDKKDGQGNCNLTRSHAATLLTQYIHTNKKLRRQKNIVLLGDFNSYANEDPIKVIENAGYSNTLAQEHTKNEYSYVYKGEVGTLDYAFVSKHLSRKVKDVNVWHNNTDEPIALDYNLNYKTDSQHETFFGSGPYRASDHDPIILDIKL